MRHRAQSGTPIITNWWLPEVVDQHDLENGGVGAGVEEPAAVGRKLWEHLRLSAERRQGSGLPSVEWVEDNWPSLRLARTDSADTPRRDYEVIVAKQ
jgi:hypothetical protein